MSKELLFSAVIISFILGLGSGFVLSPEYAVRMSEKQSMSMELGRADKFIDMRFIDGVIAHHLNAIYMAQQALKNSKRQEIKDLAQEIMTGRKVFKSSTLGKRLGLVTLVRLQTTKRLTWGHRTKILISVF